MIIVVLILLGLCLGSFVNALVWRIHEQEKHRKKPAKSLSVINGRSMCPDCHHVLIAKDLIPVLSWLMLKGKCRYCGKRISAQYPLVELATAAVFAASYIWWPDALNGAQTAVFGLWLLLLVGLMALAVYDLRWYLLPNRIIYPLSIIAAAMSLVNVTTADKPSKSLLDLILSVAIGGGIFFLLYQISAGKWIGGGDVKLGWLLGLVVGKPGEAVLLIFIASLLGSLASLPLLLAHKVKRNSSIPFGPFLIAGAYLTVLFGANILDWYQRTFIKL